MPRVTTNNTTIRPVFAVRVTDRASGTDHLADDGRYTVAKLLGRGPTALCGTRVTPASLLHPHGPVCDDCARAQAARRLTAVEPAMGNQNTCAGCGKPIPWGKVLCADCGSR